MIHSRSHLMRSKSVAIIGNYLPRICGIATFTSDLLVALANEQSDISFWAVAMNDMPNVYHYPPAVRFELDDMVITEYHLAAEFLNTNQVDAVILQHEFGIFGGEHGSHILELICNLRMPVITTLHTVLSEPSLVQRSVLKQIANVSDRLVVMSQKAKAILVNVYNIAPAKVVMIHHGIPDVPFVDPNFYKDLFNIEGRRVVLTFGLLSPNKGIEDMIEALPDVAKVYPDVVYIVLGATHPVLKREQGETYRTSLQRRAAKLGVADNILFYNRFVELKELCEFIGAADVYVTPYHNVDQIVSGTLAYALGAGKATISTPYWYAQEMLGEGRGKIVPFHDAKALGREIVGLFECETDRHAMRKRAYTFCREMIWKEVARKYLDVINEVKSEREDAPRLGFGAKFAKDNNNQTPEPKLEHLLQLTDDVGILQHAKFIMADRNHGYCTDDNARALIVALLAQDFIVDANLVTKLVCTYLSFLHHAFNEANGRFRNFMGYDRSWLEESGSEDSHGRAIWALGTAISIAVSPNIRGSALQIFEKALPAVTSLSSLRSAAFALIGVCAYLEKYGGDTRVKRVAGELASTLFNRYQENTTGDWMWFEDCMTYSNASIPHALIAAGTTLQREDLLACGLRVLEWLIKVQIDPNGHFVPVGSHDWYPKQGKKARFDQQPIEGQTTVEACYAAYTVTRDVKWIFYAQRCLEWFLGENDIGAILYDYNTGGCCDGLAADGVNRNQGAESTLAWLMSLFRFYQMRSLQIADKVAGEGKKSG